MRKIFMAISVIAIFAAISFAGFQQSNLMAKSNAAPANIAALASGSQGAYAYSSSTGRYGYAYSYNDVDSASERALEECGTDDCEVVLLFKNCGALAKGNKGAVGWAYASDVDRAESIAMGECSKHGSGCQIVSSQCN